jgi:SAM-dependent methyltransferase
MDEQVKYTAATYGDAIARHYDRLVSDRDPTSAADFLASLAPGGSYLELGIGTGRVALVLHSRGCQVIGIDSSPEMLNELRSKAGNAILAHLEDFSDFHLSQRFNVIYVVFNTLGMLLTQPEQLQCVARVAEHLAPGGKFVVEGVMPKLDQWERGRRLEVRIHGATIELEVSYLDRFRQRTTGASVLLSEAGVRVIPQQGRYIWPSELDLMAQLAGLRLAGRWGGWEGEPLEDESDFHVSLYEKAR